MNGRQPGKQIVLYFDNHNTEKFVMKAKAIEIKMVVDI